VSFSSLVSCGLVGSKARGRIVRFAIDICIIVHINEDELVSCGPVERWLDGTGSKV
jgi:hypothetical protein